MLIKTLIPSFTFLLLSHQRILKEQLESQTEELIKRMHQTDIHLSKEHITSRNHNANLHEDTQKQNAKQHASTKAHTMTTVDEATSKLQKHVSAEADALKTQLADSAMKLQQQDAALAQLKDQQDDMNRMIKSLVDNRQQCPPSPLSGHVPCVISLGSREVSSPAMRNITPQHFLIQT